MDVPDPRSNGLRRVGADRKLSKDKEAEVVAAFIRGDKLRVIENAFDITKPTIYAILDRHGVQRTRKNAPGTHDPQGLASTPEGAA